VLFEQPVLVCQTFTAFKIRRKHRFVIFKIDLETEAITVDLAGAKKGTMAEFKAALPYTDCRYAVYDYEFTTKDGRITDRLLFLTWMPHNATPYSKMAYASGKGMLREGLDGVLDCTASSLDAIEVAFGIEEEKPDSDEEGDPSDW